MNWQFLKDKKVIMGTCLLLILHTLGFMLAVTNNEYWGTVIVVATIISVLTIFRAIKVRNQE
ncbi:MULTISPECIES: hypothetical protein [Sporolactobacillus]|uniref:Uncharacterized protein n=2 Tax=Sporolactobacillus TaxID=2077 RepID=A0A0U1QMS7_9BACL|nr:MULTISPECIES: hypothetical protein [Sporolactobacillus]KLI02115.1 hypothetical protein SINU_09710 [Sporolactobacillus inulinus CASD]BBN98035.1 hypothetical protein St703_07400 [Sporolactobacillus terrae]GEB77213.1 hypothetical protein SIN01_15580 [Sporolactobacillus inulinus]